NSSGKSSIMQPLLLMKQTLEATYDPGALLLDGPNVKFTAAHQFLNKEKSPTTSYMPFSVEVKVFDSNLKVVFQKPRGNQPIEISAVDYKSADQNLNLKPQMSLEEINQQWRQRFSSEQQNIVDAKFSLVRNRFLLDLQLQMQSQSDEPSKFFY